MPAEEPLKHTMSIGEAAERLGVSVDTLARWDKSGRLKPERRTLSGRRAYSGAQILAALGRRQGQVWGYARAAGPGADASLIRQRAMLIAAGVPEERILDDCAGALDYDRPAFGSLIDRIEDDLISHLIVPYRDTLVATGHGLVERIMRHHGCALVVLSESDEQDTFFAEILAWAHREQARRFARRSRARRVHE